MMTPRQREILTVLQYCESRERDPAWNGSILRSLLARGFIEHGMIVKVSHWCDHKGQERHHDTERWFRYRITGDGRAALKATE